jgi:hypothetical protein
MFAAKVGILRRIGLAESRGKKRDDSVLAQEVDPLKAGLLESKT